MMRTYHGHEGQTRILVADWDQTNALTLSAILDRTGYEVDTVFNGEDAVVKATTFRPGLFITEPYMGRLSGIEAAAQITAMLPDCKVLVLSNDASSADIATAAPEHLVYSFTSKLLHPLDLLNVVAYLLPAHSSFAERVSMRPFHGAIDPHRPVASAATG
jgi:CheY-like chemotaxis protein